MSERVHQAVKPRGFGGVVMSTLLRRTNAAQNRATVEDLAPPEGSAVLEVGFGPGDALLGVIERRPTLLAGVDHSELMVRQAGRRLARRVGGVRLDLRIGDATSLPFAPHTFDAAFAVNSFHQWPDSRAGLVELRRVLRPGGRALLSIRVFKQDGGFESRAGGEKAVDDAERGLAQAGFEALRRTTIDLGDRLAVLVSGETPR